jgi:hypothetical protein
MKRFINTLAVMVMALILFASLAFAGDVPTRTAVTNITSTAQTYTVPNFGNGSLVDVYLYDVTPTAVGTCTVRQVVSATSSRSLTNTVLTLVAASGVRYASSGTYATNGPIARLVPGDILNFAMTGIDTGQVVFTRNVSSP